MAQLLKPSTHHYIDVVRANSTGARAVKITLTGNDVGDSIVSRRDQIGDAYADDVVIPIQASTGVCMHLLLS